MPNSLVYQSLELLDPDFHNQISRKRCKKVKNVFDLMTNNQKITKTVQRKGKKAQKIGLANSSKKLTVIEVKRNLKSKDEILQVNLKKLKKIQEICQLKLDKTVTEEIIERAVTKRPIKSKSSKKSKAIQKTAFTEEDFQKFEAEYFG